MTEPTRTSSDGLEVPRVAQTYRQFATEEPPAAIDAAIRAAAHREVDPARRARPRWAVPVSIAAVMVLSIGVVLRVQNQDPELVALQERAMEPARVHPQRAPAPAAKAVESDKKVTLEAPRRKERAAADAGEAVRATAPAIASAAALPPGTASLPSPAVAPAEAPRALSAAKPSASVARQVAPPALADRLSSGFAAAPSGESTIGRSTLAPSPTGAEPPGAREAPLSRTLQSEHEGERERRDVGRDATARAMLQGAPARSPARSGPDTDDEGDPLRWLERIARLHEEGRIDQAKKNFVAFRERYPDFVIPQRFRERLPQER